MPSGNVLAGVRRSLTPAIAWTNVTPPASALSLPLTTLAGWTQTAGNYTNVGLTGTRFGVNATLDTNLSYQRPGPPASASYTVTGLVPGANYRVRVTAATELCSNFYLAGETIVAGLSSGQSRYGDAAYMPKVGGGDVSEVLALGVVTLSLPVVATAGGAVTITLGVFAVFGAYGLQLFFSNLAVVPEGPGTPASGLLLFARPLDEALAWSAPRLGSRRVDVDGGGSGRSIWHEGDDHFLSGVARRIPRLTSIQPNGLEATGWESALGWQDFLVAARDGRPLTFHPNRADLTVGLPVRWWEQGVERPVPDVGARFLAQRLTLIASHGPLGVPAAVPFDGY